MAVTFNGPLKVSRPGFTADGLTINSNAPINRQAWFAPVQSVMYFNLDGSNVAGLPDIIPAGSLITGVSALITTVGSAATQVLTLSLTSSAPTPVTAPIATITQSATGGFIVGAATPAQVANWTVATDSSLSSSGNGGGAVGLYIVEFIARNADGSLSDEGFRPFVG